MGQVQFGFAAGQQADAGAGLGEAHGQALADSSARSGYQDRFLAQGMQR